MKKKFEFPVLVREEAKNLMKFATKEERNNLNFNGFAPQRTTGCIYGQLTGHCFSARAEELIKKCASKVYHASATMNIGFLSDKLVGSPDQRERYKCASGRLTTTDFFSPIEVFVYLKENQISGANEYLIKYLKGEIETL